MSTEQAAGVDLLDGLAHRRLAKIKIRGIGAKPMGLAMAPDGSVLYVSTGRGGTVACIDVATSRVVRVFEHVGARPWGVGVSPKGDRLYTANGSSDDVSVIDSSTGRVLRRIQSGRLPWGVAVSTELP